MAQAKKKATAPARTAAKPTANKAAQAAQHQNRPAPAQSAQTRPASPPQQHNVPARVQHNVPATAAGVANLPAHMRQFVDQGKEMIGQQDMEIPRLKLMQGLSPELEAYDGLKAGDFFHIASEHVFNEPFRAVPIFMDMQYILWKPRDSGGGILARASDGVHWSPAKGEHTVQLDKKDGGDTVTWRLAPTVAESGLANWGTLNPRDPNSPPAATLMYNYLLAFPDFPDLMPAVLTLQRSSIKAAKRFNTKLKTVRAPIYGTVWTFASAKDTNSRGQDFFNVDVSGAGFVEDAGMFEQFRSGYEAFSKKGLSIKDIETLQEADAPDEGSTGEGAQGQPSY